MFSKKKDYSSKILQGLNEVTEALNEVNSEIRGDNAFQEEANKLNSDLAAFKQTRSDLIECRASESSTLELSDELKTLEDKIKELELDKQQKRNNLFSDYTKMQMRLVSLSSSDDILLHAAKMTAKIMSIGSKIDQLDGKQTENSTVSDILSLELTQSLKSFFIQLKKLKESIKPSFFKVKDSLQRKEQFNVFLENFEELLKQEDLKYGQPLSYRFNNDILSSRAESLQPFTFPSSSQQSQTDDANAIEASVFSPRP